MWRRACSRSTAGSSARRLTRGRAQLARRLRNLDRDQRVTILAGSATRTGRRCGGSGCAAPAGESPERTHAIGLLEREYQQFAAAPAEAGGRVLAAGIDWSGWACSWFRSGHHGPEEHIRHGRPDGCCRQG